jgi:hypothetical protein
MLKELSKVLRSYYWRFRDALGFGPVPSNEEISAAIKKALQESIVEDFSLGSSSKVCLVTFDDGRRDICANQIHDRLRCDIFRVEIGGSGCSIVDGPCSKDARVGRSD